MARGVLFCVILAFCCCCLSPAVLAQQVLVAKDFFLGDWQLESQKSSLENPAAVSLVDTSAWKIKDGNLTLFGTYVDEKDEERAIHIDFDSDREGRFSLALPEEEDHIVIFHFVFENRTAGYYISQGLWKDDHRGETGSYQLLVTSPASFVLSVFLKNSEGHFSEVNVITGRKFVEKEPPGFLQRFGMPMALFAIILVSQFFKGRGAPAEPAQPATRPGTNTDAEPRITEITDDDGGAGAGEAEAEASTDSKKDK